MCQLTEQISMMSQSSRIAALHQIPRSALQNRYKKYNTANFKSIRTSLTPRPTITFLNARIVSCWSQAKNSTTRPLESPYKQAPQVLHHHCRILSKLRLSVWFSWHGTSISEIVCSINIGTNDAVNYNNRMEQAPHRTQEHKFERQTFQRNKKTDFRKLSVPALTLLSLCFYSMFSVFPSLCVILCAF